MLNIYDLMYFKLIVKALYFSGNKKCLLGSSIWTLNGGYSNQNFYCYLTYTYKKAESKLYYSNEDNLFSQIPIANTDANFIRFTNKNYINTQRLGMHLI